MVPSPVFSGAIRETLDRYPITDAASCVADDDPGLTDNDDDAAGPEGDYLPEEAFIEGTCDATFFHDAYFDATPLVDPDGDRLPGTNAETTLQPPAQSKAIRECDARQFGHEHRSEP